jgi:hypothetical protein
VPTFADTRCRVVSEADPHGRILGFLDRIKTYKGNQNIRIGEGAVHRGFLFRYHCARMTFSQGCVTQATNTRKISNLAEYLASEHDTRKCSQVTLCYSKGRREQGRPSRRRLNCLMLERANKLNYWWWWSWVRGVSKKLREAYYRVTLISSPADLLGLAQSIYRQATAWATGVWFQPRERDLPHSTMSKSSLRGTNLLSNGYGGFFNGGKAAGAWGWPLTSI